MRFAGTKVGSPSLIPPPAPITRRPAGHVTVADFTVAESFTLAALVGAWFGKAVAQIACALMFHESAVWPETVCAPAYAKNGSERPGMTSKAATLPVPPAMSIPAPVTSLPDGQSAARAEAMSSCRIPVLVTSPALAAQIA